MSSSDNSLIKVAVIEGWHPFDVIGFRDLFRSIEGIDPYHQTIDNWAIDCAGFRKKYDVLVFYNMNMQLNPDADPFHGAILNAINEMGDTEGQGILFLHHSILAYPDNEEWSAMVGIKNRKFDYHLDQTFEIAVANNSHPIAKGVSSWQHFDETYTMDSAAEGSEVLFTAQHEKSMKSIGWTRQYKQSRVFCFQPGHDNRSWVDPNFRKVLAQGIQWLAGRL